MANQSPEALPSHDFDQSHVNRRRFYHVADYAGNALNSPWRFNNRDLLEHASISEENQTIFKCSIREPQVAANGSITYQLCGSQFTNRRNQVSHVLSKHVDVLFETQYARSDKIVSQAIQIAPFTAISRRRKNDVSRMWYERPLGHCRGCHATMKIFSIYDGEAKIILNQPLLRGAINHAIDLLFRSDFAYMRNGGSSTSVYGMSVYAFADHACEANIFELSRPNNRRSRAVEFCAPVYCTFCHRQQQNIAEFCSHIAFHFPRGNIRRLLDIYLHSGKEPLPDSLEIAGIFHFPFVELNNVSTFV